MITEMMTIHGIEVPFYPVSQHPVDFEDAFGHVKISAKLYKLLQDDEYWGRRALLVYAHPPRGVYEAPKKMFFTRRKGKKSKGEPAWYLSTAFPKDDRFIREALEGTQYVGTTTTEE